MGHRGGRHDTDRDGVAPGALKHLLQFGLQPGAVGKDHVAVVDGRRAGRRGHVAVGIYANAHQSRQLDLVAAHLADRGALPADDLPRRDEATGERRYRSAGVNPWIEIPILTHLPLSSESRHSRNHVNVLTADALVALPGGSGTLSEVRLRLQYGRRVIVFLGDPKEGLTIGGRTAEELREEARLQAEKQAGLRIQEADQQAQKLVSEARRLAEDSERALADLNARRASYLRGMRSLLDRFLAEVSYEEARLQGAPDAATEMKAPEDDSGDDE